MEKYHDFQNIGLVRAAGPRVPGCRCVHISFADGGGMAIRDRWLLRGIAAGLCCCQQFGEAAFLILCAELARSINLYFLFALHMDRN